MLLNETNYEKLQKSIEKNIDVYNYQLEILKKIKLLTKKDGSAFKDPLKMFDIETLKKYFSNKYGFAFGNGSYLFLSDSEYDYKINCSFKNLEFTLYLSKRVYIDECNEETRKTKAFKTINNGFTRAYYENNTPEELKEETEKRKEWITGFLNKEKIKHKALEKLKKNTINYLSKINDELFYRSEISSLIDY